MLAYKVTYTEDGIPDQSFTCFADDVEHAKEQCTDAYPECTIDETCLIHTAPYDTVRLLRQNWTGTDHELFTLIWSILNDVRLTVAVALGDEIETPLGSGVLYEVEHHSVENYGMI